MPARRGTTSRALPCDPSASVVNQAARSLAMQSGGYRSTMTGAGRFAAVVVAAVRRFDMEQAGDPTAGAVFMGRLDEIDAVRQRQQDEARLRRLLPALAPIRPST